QGLGDPARDHRLAEADLGLVLTMTAPKTSTTRHYESPVRRQQALETRQKIIEAGCKVLRRSGIRDWRGLTIRGVAEQAGVNERTVYRYFGNERGLRDAV